jgi:hypothetical protein
MKIRRRDFLKLSVAGSAVTALGKAIAEPFFEPALQEEAYTEQWLPTICLMCPGGCGILISQDLNDLLAYMRADFSSEGVATNSPSFVDDVMPIFAEKCSPCHGSAGGWDSTNFEAVMNTGAHAPNVIPGDADNSPLARRILGTQSEGGLMPPAGMMPEGEIEIILNWILAGALDN